MMLPLALALLWFLYKLLVRHTPMEGYAEATALLFFLYTASLVIALSYIVLVTLVFGTTNHRFQTNHRAIDKLRPFLQGSYVGAWIGSAKVWPHLVVLTPALFGAWLLRQADDDAYNLSSLDKMPLITGSLLVLLSMVLKITTRTSSVENPPTINT